MVYSEYLRQPDIQEAFKAAGVAKEPSLLTEDFIVHPDLDKQTIIDHEIIYRRKILELKKQEHDAYFEPYRKKEPRVNAARKYVEEVMSGREFVGAYASIKNEIISFISSELADRHDFTNINENPKEDLSGFSELDRLIKKYHVTYLDEKRETPQDIALNFILNSDYVKMIK